MEQQFSLSWKNFHGNLSNGFASLLDSGEFVDVTLACDGQLLQAHRVVLSICSPYFKRMFQLNPCQHPIVVLRDVSLRAMRDLIHFMYNGEVSVRQEDLAGFINTAETLEIKGLTNKHSDEENCEELHKNTSPTISSVNNDIHNAQETTTDSADNLSQPPDNSHNQMELLNSLRLAALKRKSEEFITNNFNSDIREAANPEKRIKLREKQILNRHKIINNYQRGSISVKNFDTKLRNDTAPPNVNLFESLANDHGNKKTERSNPYHEIRNNSVIQENNTVDIVSDIKKEEPDNDTFEDSLPKSVITYERRSESENRQMPESPRLDQEDGANTVDLPNIVRASWPMTHGKLSSARLSGGQPSSGNLLSAQHTIITIPQKEDGALSLVMDHRSTSGHLPVRYHYIYSRKGHKQLVHMNFVYTKHSTSHGKTSWRCVQYFSLNRCPATVETVGAMIYAVNHVHNHEHCLDKIVKNSVYEMDDVVKE